MYVDEGQCTWMKGSVRDEVQCTWMRCSVRG